MPVVSVGIPCMKTRSLTDPMVLCICSSTEPSNGSMRHGGDYGDAAKTCCRQEDHVGPVNNDELLVWQRSDKKCFFGLALKAYFLTIGVIEKSRCKKKGSSPAVCAIGRYKFDATRAPYCGHF